MNKANPTSALPTPLPPSYPPKLIILVILSVDSPDDLSLEIRLPFVPRSLNSI